MKTTSVCPFAALPLLAAAGLLVGVCPAAHAAVVIIAPTATTAGSFTITAPITFTIGTAGNARVFAFDELVTSDGSETGSPYSPGLSFSINGGPAMSSGGVFVDNRGSTLGALTPNDGYTGLDNAFAVAVGNTVTLNAGSYNLAATSNFNPQATQTFTGNMFVATDLGVRLSGNFSAGPAAIPEPSTYALALLGGAGLLGAVRRSRRA